MDSEDYNLKQITPMGIQALLAYIPYFESNQNFGRNAEINNGCISNSTLSKKASAFIQTCYEHNVVQNFDWSKWSDEHYELVHEGKGIETLGLEGIGKLLTAYCRADRFCDGLFLSVMIDGQILRILKRLDILAKNFNNKVTNE